MNRCLQIFFFTVPSPSFLPYLLIFVPHFRSAPYLCLWCWTPPFLQRWAANSKCCILYSKILSPIPLKDITFQATYLSKLSQVLLPVQTFYKTLCLSCTFQVREVALNFNTLKLFHSSYRLYSFTEVHGSLWQSKQISCLIYHSY